MNKLILLFAVLSLMACSSTNTGMKFENKGPRTISIYNLMKQDHAKAYRAAEKHCAKYYKVPRVLKKTDYQSTDDSHIPMRSLHFECIKPSN